ncbi:hypothetical protein RUND412_004949 [Rhizina undulata]
MSGTTRSGEGEGEFGADIPRQRQELPGLEKDLAPTSESTRLEGPDGFQEYKGVDKLKGKKVIITGGDSGIGRATALLMAREGADITIVHLPSEEEDATAVQRLISRENQRCLLITFDLARIDDIKEVVDKHVEEFGRIDVLVNNAARQAMCEDIERIDMEEVKSTFDTNIVSMFALCKHALPHMSKGSAIINSTSIVAFRGTAAMVDYAATKGAIVAFTRSLAKQLMPRGIRVNAVAPGPVHTPLQPASRPAEQMEGFGSKTGIGRPGQPSEVAPSYVFLASAEAELYYGQVLHAYPLG